MSRSVISYALTLGLAFTLGACQLFPSAPGVVSVNPRDDATDVGTDTTIVATLNVPTDDPINLTTLTDVSVSLTQTGGGAVASTRILSEDGKTLTVTPAAALAPSTGYEFNVTTALETASGTSLGGWSSTFTTGTGAGSVPPSESGLVPDRSPVVFTAGGATQSDTRTLTLTNGSGSAIDVASLSIGGAAAAQFALADSSAFSLGAGESKTLELTFTTAGPGPQLATLTVVSNADTTPTLTIPLGGLGVKGQGGGNEPSLQWIFDTYGLPIQTGDTDPSTTGIAASVDESLLGEEVDAQNFVKAPDATNVSIEVLATFGVENDPVLEFGHYAGGNAGARTKLFDIQQTPGLNSQRLDPEVNGPTGDVTFDPGTAPFGFYSFWPTNRFFPQRNVFTENSLNTFADAIPHQVRAYPLKNADGSLEPNAYVLATEEFTQGFDYNDIVVIVRNVVPQEPVDLPTEPTPPVPPTPPGSGIGGLSVYNPLGQPSSDRLVLQKIERTTGNFCDPVANPDCDPTFDKWTGMTFPNTGVVRLENTGAAALPLTLSFAYPDQFRFPNGEGLLTLQPGQSYDLEIEFSPVGRTQKVVLPDALIVDSGGVKAGLQLAGVFMRRPEGSSEVYLKGLINDAFGYQTDLGANGAGGVSSPEVGSPLAGDEVRSSYWQAANPGAPVSILQLAAFHTCCNLRYNLQLFARGSSSALATLPHLPGSGQSIYPRASKGSGVAELSTNVSGPFEITIGNYSSDPTKGRGDGYYAVRFWPLKNQGGGVVANTYIVAQDFISDGCGGSTAPDPDPVEDSSRQTAIASNCDYNDNVYLMSNMQPAD